MALMSAKCLSDIPSASELLVFGVETSHRPNVADNWMLQLYSQAEYFVR